MQSAINNINRHEILVIVNGCSLHCSCLQLKVQNILPADKASREKLHNIELKKIYNDMEWWQKQWQCRQNMTTCKDNSDSKKHIDSKSDKEKDNNTDNDNKDTYKVWFDQQGWYGMFVACGIWCLADVSSVSPSSEQKG